MAEGPPGTRVFASWLRCPRCSSRCTLSTTATTQLPARLLPQAPVVSRGHAPRPGRDRRHGDQGRPRDRGFLDDADEIAADGDEGGVFLLALGVFALAQENRELRRNLDDRDHGL